ncbi:DUF6020 family protein [Bifidobacterium sp. CP2]|uniref:DUF6020 family protein n=1 Tax=Bifidobacterium sp. CP2 TaxID=2809025 RepID=UPI001C842396|nr:DUF6020 family protein [Bifidobacterium sp. CP2]
MSNPVEHPSTSVRASAANPTDPARPTRPARVAPAARWALAVAACLWLAWCTAVGPLYWDDSSLADFNWVNASYGVVAFVVYLAIVAAIVRVGRREPLFGRRAHGRRDGHDGRDVTGRTSSEDKQTARTDGRTRRIARAVRTGLHRAGAVVQRWIVRGTDARWKIGVILFLGWLWAPTTLLAAFGADLRSQAREFSWAWNQWTGLKQPYIGFFSFAPMDIYPTAHYMWPSDPTYLTDQHNIVLTLFYGSVMAASRYLTDSNDWGIVVLAAVQFLFAVGCVTATAHRFLNMPWLRRAGRPGRAGRAGYVDRTDFQHPERGVNLRPRRFGRPELGVRATLPPQAAHAGARVAIILFFLVCPLAVFSTISLTKSPVFAFAFLWAFGIWYELHATHDARDDTRASTRGGRPLSAWSGRLGRFRFLRHGRSDATVPSGRLAVPIARLPRRTLLAFTAANAVMLISAKYAWYVLVFEFALAIAADRRRWTTYVTALLLPTILIHGGISLAIGSGAIIGGDPIESRGVQLQMIARVAERDPDSIPSSAVRNLSPVFNLDQMADAYFPQDADPVKSSGIQSKKVSYKWRSVQPQDMDGFNQAWLEIVKASPVIAADALMAKCFGYFDIADQPYVAMTYYVDSDYVQVNSTWIKYYDHDWRAAVAGAADAWSAVPVLGWPIHGNFYVIATLLVGAAEVILRRWRALAWHLPLLLLMGVMITAPANNFERHMLPVAFCFGFLLLTFWRDSRAPAPRTAELH